MAPKNRLKQNKILPKYWRLKNGSYSYRVPPHLRHLHGDRTEVSLGQSLSIAYKRFADLHETDECITLMRELLDRYSLEIVPNHTSKNTRDYKITALGRLRQVMGDNLVSSITPQFIYQYRDMVGKAKSHRQANQDLEVLSHVFTKAIEWGVMADHLMTNKKVVKFPSLGRDRYVEDWELQEWAKVANPFLVVYIVLKGVTGLRQQDLLTIKKKDITETELVSVNIKTGKKLRFPLLTSEGGPTTVQLALDVVNKYYNEENIRRSKGKTLLPPVVSPWLFRTRKGDGYYNYEAGRASGFRSIWQRSMAKALEKTTLAERFTEHDLRAKVGSDIESDIDAQKLLAHADAATTRKHYRRKGSLVVPAGGFSMKKK